jgi:hypothetical protein
VVQSVDEFADGVKRIKAMAKDAGRNPDGFDFTVFALEGQWRSAKQIAELERVGATRVVLWAPGLELNDVLRGIEDMASTVLV